MIADLVKNSQVVGVKVSVGITTSHSAAGIASLYSFSTQSTIHPSSSSRGISALVILCGQGAPSSNQPLPNCFSKRRISTQLCWAYHLFNSSLDEKRMDRITLAKRANQVIYLHSPPSTLPARVFILRTLICTLVVGAAPTHASQMG